MTNSFEINVADPSGRIDAILEVSGDQVSLAIGNRNYSLNVGGLTSLGLSPSSK